MTLEAMQRTIINGTELEIWDRGSGEPVVFVHGAMGDECAAVLGEPVLADQFHLIHYHRRGYGNSEGFKNPVSISKQAVDCRAVMQHLGVERAHLVGQSYGGVILLQMAKDFPDAVHSLSLLEPSLPSIFNSPEFNGMAEEAASFYEGDDKASAIETFAKGVAGADYRSVFDRTLPSGYFERWVADADTILQSDMPALQPWTFTPEDAVRITQPVLNATGVNTTSYFRQCHETVKTWLPHAENFVVTNATHCMLQDNPQVIAERLANFFSDHPIQEM